MHGPEVIVLVVVVLGLLFIGLPWLVFHYITKWKSQATITTEDENLLDELHDLARRLDERMGTIERIVQADNPNWRALASDPVETALEDRTERIYEAGRTTNRPTRRN
jgi:phage shock protein B